jgi:hypothetical protein
MGRKYVLEHTNAPPGCYHAKRSKLDCYEKVPVPSPFENAFISSRIQLPIKKLKVPLGSDYPRVS